MDSLRRQNGGKGRLSTSLSPPAFATSCWSRPLRRRGPCLSLSETFPAARVCGSPAASVRNALNTSLRRPAATRALFARHPCRTHWRGKRTSVISLSFRCAAGNTGISLSASPASAVSLKQCLNIQRRRKGKSDKIFSENVHSPCDADAVYKGCNSDTIVKAY